MGGIGSGWFGRRSRQATIDESLALDLRRWRQQSLLTPFTCFTLSWASQGRSFGPVAVWVGPDRVTVGDTVIGLQWTPGSLGGRRVWFSCPRCQRRCCVLYGATDIACRACLRLVYPVEREAPARRLMRRLRKTISRAKIDTSRRALKPKWQRWRTYWRLAGESERAGERLAALEDRVYEILRDADKT